MRHTDAIIELEGELYAVSPRIAGEVRALLERAKVKPQHTAKPYVRAEEIYPELNDPIMGPANYLRGMRRRAQLTQAALAEHSGMKQHHISEMESGKRAISKAAAKKLAVILNTDWRRFL